MAVMDGAWAAPVDSTDWEVAVDETVEELPSPSVREVPASLDDRPTSMASLAPCLAFSVVERDGSWQNRKKRPLDFA